MLYLLYGFIILTSLFGIFILAICIWDSYIRDWYREYKWSFPEKSIRWRSYMTVEECKKIKKGDIIRRIKDSYRQVYQGELYTVKYCECDTRQTVYLKEADGEYDLRLFELVTPAPSKDIPWL